MGQRTQKMTRVMWKISCNSVKDTVNSGDSPRSLFLLLLLSSFSPPLSFVRLHFLSFSFCIIIFICVFPKPLHVIHWKGRRVSAFHFFFSFPT